jgi:hypothetical protein
MDPIKIPAVILKAISTVLDTTESRAACFFCILMATGFPWRGYKDILMSINWADNE